MKLTNIQKVLLENPYFNNAPLEDLINEKVFYKEKNNELYAFLCYLKRTPTMGYGSILSDEAKNKVEGLIDDIDTLNRLYEKYIKKLSDRIDERFFEIKELTK